MGFFSWKCAVSGESIANVHSGQPKYKSKCYLVTPEATYYESAYEGYGDFGGYNVYALIGDGDRDKGIYDYLEKNDPKFRIKVVLERYYNNQSYDELEESEDCEYQGYFYDEYEED